MVCVPFLHPLPASPSPRVVCTSFYPSHRATCQPFSHSLPCCMDLSDEGHHGKLGGGWKYFPGGPVCLVPHAGCSLCWFLGPVAPGGGWPCSVSSRWVSSLALYLSLVVHPSLWSSSLPVRGLPWLVPLSLTSPVSLFFLSHALSFCLASSLSSSFFLCNFWCHPFSVLVPSTFAQLLWAQLASPRPATPWPCGLSGSRPGFHPPWDKGEG